jgi:predicted metal-dependent enzyme (double-stranded beta helix superfamily)
MFSIDNFIEDCRTAVSGTDPHQAVQALVERAVSDPTGLMAGLGEPKRAGVNKLYVSDDLTVLNLIWGPQMILMPHNPEMWAATPVAKTICSGVACPRTKMASSKQPARVHWSPAMSQPLAQMRFTPFTTL